MADKKIEVQLTFEDFAKKYKDVIELKQLKAETYQKLLTVKAVEDQTKELGFSDAWKKELTDKINKFEPIATQELKDASENINKYLFNLVKAVFEYHKVVIEMPSDEALKNMSKKVRGLVAAGGGQLQPDFIFNAVKVLYID